MEFSCSKEELQNGVSIVERIVATRTTLPILGNILFEATKSGLRLSATNLEIGIEILLEANLKSEGALLLPAKTLGAVVSKLPTGEVKFRLSEKGLLRLSYNASHFNLHTLPAEEFPALPKIKEGKTLQIPLKQWIEMLKKTIFAVSQSEESPVLSGVLLEVGKIEGDDSNLRLVATDGYRLAKIGSAVNVDQGNYHVIIPQRALAELLRILQGEEDGEIKVTISADQVSFRYQELYLVSRLIQGQFPDYKQVIPKKSAMKLTVKTQAFLEAAERAAVVASGSANIVRFEVKADKLHLIANTPEVGSIEEVLDVETKGKGENTVSFNIRLITDGLKAVEATEVQLELSESLSPGVIREGEDYLYIVMPIRTQETAA